MSMTENEAIKQIKSKACNDRCISSLCNDGCMYGNEKCAFAMAIQALEKIQQYRAIGTVEELQKIKDGFQFATDIITNYLAIGTIEECRTAVEKMKHISVKPVHVNYVIKNTGRNKHIIFCGKCGKYNHRVYVRDKYCGQCGTEIDWT